jgi:hypothetical protein
LAIHFGDGLGQHLAVARVGCSLELLRQPLAGKNQALPSAVALLLVGREGWPRRFARVGHLSLLLFDRLALPPAGHVVNPSRRPGDNESESARSHAVARFIGEGKREFFSNLLGGPTVGAREYVVLKKEIGRMIVLLQQRTQPMRIKAGKGRRHHQLRARIQRT